MLSISIARQLTTGRRADLLTRIRPNDPKAAAMVHVVTPRRFVSLRKLIRPNEAIDGMLEVIATMQVLCAERGISCHFGVNEAPIRSTPALYLSHHTFDSPVTARLRTAGTDVWHFKAADMPGRTTLDPTGFSGWSTMAQHDVDSLRLDQIAQQEADAYFVTARDQTLTRNTSKYKQDAQSVAPTGDYVFVALQTIGDLVQRKAYVPMLDMLAMVVARFAGTGTRVVIKRHPKCRSPLVSAALRKLATNPEIAISQASIHRLLAGARALFTVNSGVGSEALVHGIPIYCFGASDYAAAAHQIRNDTTLRALTQPIHHRCTPDMLRRFHYYYRNIYQIERQSALVPRLSALLDGLA